MTFEAIKERFFRRRFLEPAELLQSDRLARLVRPGRRPPKVKPLWKQRMPYRVLTPEDRQRIILLRFGSLTDFSQIKMKVKPLARMKR